MLDFNYKLVEQLQDRLRDALKVHMTRPRNNDVFVFQSVMALLPELRALSMKHNDKLEWYRSQWNYLTNMPPLFAEIFDIPKNDTEVRKTSEW